MRCALCFAFSPRLQLGGPARLLLGRHVLLLQCALTCHQEQLPIGTIVSVLHVRLSPSLMSTKLAAHHEIVRISNQNIRNAHASLYYHTKKTARTYCQNLVFSVARGNQRQPAMKPFVSKLKRSCFEACFEMWDMQRQVPQFDAGAGQLVE